MNSKLKKLFRGKNERTGGKSKLKSLWKKAKTRLEKAVLVSALAAGVSMGVSACGDTITNNYYYYNQRDGGSDVVQMVDAGSKDAKLEDAETKQATSLCDLNPATISLSMPLRDENTLDKRKYYFWKPEDLPHIIQVTTATSDGVVLSIYKKQPSEDGFRDITYEGVRIISSGDFNKNLEVSLDDGDAELAVCDVSFGSSLVRITMAGEGEFCAGPVKLQEHISQQTIETDWEDATMNIFYSYVVPESCEVDFTPAYLLDVHIDYPGIPVYIDIDQPQEQVFMPEVIPEIPFLEPDTYLIGISHFDFIVGRGEHEIVDEGEGIVFENYRFNLESIETDEPDVWAIISVYDTTTNNLVGRFTIYPKELKEFTVNNEAYTIVVSRIAPGFTQGARWAEMAVLKDVKDVCNGINGFDYTYQAGESYHYSFHHDLFFDYPGPYHNFGLRYYRVKIDGEEQ